MDRSQHLKWCKDRALKYCKKGDISDAYASMISDLNKHDETRGHAAIELGMMMMMAGQLATVSKREKFINDIN